VIYQPMIEQDNALRNHASDYWWNGSLEWYTNQW